MSRVSTVKTFFDGKIISTHTFKRSLLRCVGSFQLLLLTLLMLLPFILSPFFHQSKVITLWFQVLSSLFFLHQNPRQLFKWRGFFPCWQPCDKCLVIINNSVECDRDQIWIRNFSPISPNVSFMSLILAMNPTTNSFSSIFNVNSFPLSDKTWLVFCVWYRFLVIVQMSRRPNVIGRFTVSNMWVNIVLNGHLQYDLFFCLLFISILFLCGWSWSQLIFCHDQPHIFPFK